MIDLIVALIIHIGMFAADMVVTAWLYKWVSWLKQQGIPVGEGNMFLYALFERRPGALKGLAKFLSIRYIICLIPWILIYFLWVPWVGTFVLVFIGGANFIAVVSNFVNLNITVKMVIAARHHVDISKMMPWDILKIETVEELIGGEHVGKEETNRTAPGGTLGTDNEHGKI